ncbi:rhodanese [Neptunitalea chrysea]|uniref:Rhodanese n=1 Tax=Neptunitalea chrysea TaxID=1647581 RepID=A0A9W6EUU1_9FLAO|nr:rhodanese-like domain-containing protein [Neptunitalea chrysea]GLB52131.1 rhodanese [Neptunitalea chrysea]
MNLSQEEWAEQFKNDDNAFLLDVRTPEEFEEVHIPGATNIDIHKGQGFVYEVDELDKSKNFYVYCRSGARSAKACEVLNQLGVANTYNLLGGILDWKGETE